MDQEPQSESEKTPPKISPIINVENGDKKVQITIQDVDSLFQDTNQYNNQFSLGATMFSLLTQHLKNEETGEENSLTKGIDEEAQHMSASALSVIHERTLDNLGLVLEPVSGKTVTVFTSEGSAGLGEMRFNIKDRSQFGSFLKGLEVNQVAETPLKQHLGKLTDILSQQILDNYSLQEPDDKTLSFLGSLDTIVNEYNRLGLQAEATPMQEYLTHTREGNLREFVALKNSRLMQEPGKGFGPADWVKDASSDFLHNRWTEALQLLRTLRNNTKAVEMYDQLLNHLNRCVPIALSNLDELQYYTPEAKQKLKDELTAAQDGLKAFET